MKRPTPPEEYKYYYKYYGLKPLLDKNIKEYEYVEALIKEGKFKEPEFEKPEHIMEKIWTLTHANPKCRDKFTEESPFYKPDFESNNGEESSTNNISDSNRKNKNQKSSSKSFRFPNPHTFDGETET